MLSCYQNAYMLLPTMISPIIIFRERPVIPLSAEHYLSEADCGSVTVEAVDGTIFQWFKDGTVYVVEQTGIKIIFPGRPPLSVLAKGKITTAEFFMNYLSFQAYSTGNYIEFNRNGSVIYRRGGITFLWSPEFSTQTVQGRISCSRIMRDEDISDDEFWLRERRDSYS
jgi:hypothetical protein